MRQMAVEMPITGVVRDELDIARLRHTHQHRVRRFHGRRPNPSALTAGDVELMAMQVNRMVVHPEVH